MFGVSTVFLGSLALPAICVKMDQKELYRMQLEAGTDSETIQMPDMGVVLDDVNATYEMELQQASLGMSPLTQTMDRSDNSQEETKKKENIAKKARPKIINHTRKDGVFTHPEDGHDVAAMRVVWNEKSVSKKKKILLKKIGKDKLQGLLKLPAVVKAKIESYLVVGLVAPAFGGTEYEPGSLVRFIDENGKIRQGQLAGLHGQLAGSSPTKIVVTLPRRSWLPCVMFDGDEPEVAYEKILSVTNPPPKAGPIYGCCVSVLCCVSTLNNCCHPVVGFFMEQIPDDEGLCRYVGIATWGVCCLVPFCVSSSAACPCAYLRIAFCGCTNDENSRVDMDQCLFMCSDNFLIKERCGIPCPCPYPEPEQEWYKNACYRESFHANALCMWPCSIWYPYIRGDKFSRPKSI